MSSATGPVCRNCSAPMPGKKCQWCGTGTRPIEVVKPEERKPLIRNPFSALFGLFDRGED